MLGHFEFGFGHKPFFKRPERESTLDINYWLEIWINSYEEVLLHMQDYKKRDTTLLLSYQDLCNRPEKVATAISTKLGLPVKFKASDFEIKRYERNDPYDRHLMKRAISLYDALKSYSYL